MCVSAQGQLQSLGAQWDFMESLKGGSFLAQGTSTEQPSPDASVGAH